MPVETNELEGIAPGDFAEFIARTLTPDPAVADPDEDDDEPEDDDASDDDQSDEADDDEDEADDEDEESEDEDADEEPPSTTRRAKKTDDRLSQLEAQLLETRTALKEAAQLAKDREAALSERDLTSKQQQREAEMATKLAALQDRWSKLPPEQAAGELNMLVMATLRDVSAKQAERDQRDLVEKQMAEFSAQHDYVVDLLANGHRVENGVIVENKSEPLTAREIENLRHYEWNGHEMQAFADRCVEERKEQKRTAKNLLQQQRRRESGDAERSGISRDGTRRSENGREPESLRELIDDIDFGMPAKRSGSHARR